MNTWCTLYDYNGQDKRRVYEKITKLAKLGKYKQYNEFMRRFEKCEPRHILKLEEDLDYEI